MSVTIFWYRRDLRVEDNTALFHAIKSKYPVIPIFIFDTNITSDLPIDDGRISFIYNSLFHLNQEFKQKGGSILLFKGETQTIWNKLIRDYDIKEVYINSEYEPYTIKRDFAIKELLQKNNINLYSFKDSVVFEKDEIQKQDNTPYTVYSPYKKKWKSNYNERPAHQRHVSLTNLLQKQTVFPSIENIGFKQSIRKIRPINYTLISEYQNIRDYPEHPTTNLGPHLRYGTVSIRTLISDNIDLNPTFVDELIWREFFIQILYHFPQVINENFNPKYDSIQWENDENNFEKWRKGKTGYPIVDAGMEELNNTGYMHNRVRMIAASFLCKHLLIDWRWGEAYFAEKLLDYDLALNNGNWQWAASTGCDAVPYFRIFNPIEQLRKFDPNHNYIKKWLPNLYSTIYPQPIIDHKFARNRAIERYKKCTSNKVTN